MTLLFGAQNGSGAMRLALYDVSGARIAVLFDGAITAGTSQHVRWDGRAASGTQIRAGVYWLRASFEGRALSRRVIFVR